MLFSRFPHRLPLYNPRIIISFADDNTSAVDLSGSSLFAPVSVPSGVLKIISVLSGKALDIPNASTLNGAPLQQYDYVSGSNQQFQLTSVTGQ